MVGWVGGGWLVGWLGGWLSIKALTNLRGIKHIADLKGIPGRFFGTARKRPGTIIAGIANENISEVSIQPELCFVSFWVSK